VARGASRPPDDPLAEWVQGCRVGDEQAVARLVRSLGPTLLRVVRRILGSDHPEVEDVTQEATFELLAALHEFRGECSVTHFACRIAVLTAMNARRRQRVRARFDRPLHMAAAAEVQWSGPSPSEEVELRECRRALRLMLDNLPEAQAEVLALHCVLGYTLEETALATTAPLNTVRGRLVRAKAALRKRLLASAWLKELVLEKPCNQEG
jgi:RNA polymerase sigma factor (sigma-70 family)